MIAYANPIACGNAVRVLLNPDADADAWRILRRTDQDFSGPDDPDARSYEGDMSDLALVDYTDLINGQPYWYRSYFLVDGDWIEDDTVEITPAASFVADTPDPQDVLIERIDAGLRAEVARGLLSLPPGRDAVEVLRAFAVWDETRFPVVTVEFVSAETSDRALGEAWADDEDLGPSWREFEGWKRHYTLAVVAWSLNPDQRIDLRRALERILLANLAVFDAAGLYDLDCQWQDVFDDLQYDAPVYSAIGTVSCAALSRVGSDVAKITDVEIIRDCEKARGY